MAGVVVVASAIAVVVSRNAFTCAQSAGHRGWSRLWMPFDCDPGLFLLAESFGYTSRMHDRLLANSAWAGEGLGCQLTISFLASVAGGFSSRYGVGHTPARRVSRA